jgi:hypothetical protein
VKGLGLGFTKVRSKDPDVECVYTPRCICVAVISKYDTSGPVCSFRGIATLSAQNSKPTYKAPALTRHALYLCHARPPFVAAIRSKAVNAIYATLYFLESIPSPRCLQTLHLAEPACVHTHAHLAPLCQRAGTNERNEL